ncbi:MAG: protein kinase domain-containing protein [Gemmatimonadales bacterium]
MNEVDARLARALESSYRLTRELGRGGTATVYLAEDLRHSRQVAVKVLHPEFVQRGSVERFLREIRIAAHLQHPHILPLLDSGESDGFLYFVMPFVEGETLRERIRREGQLPVPDILRILSDVVDAVAHAHARGFIHRDIKPENVLVAGRHALVTDFGVARALSLAGPEEGLTQGVALGTPSYMAPEQATAAPDVDHRADIYALGVLAYEVLAGRPPFTGPTAQEILTAHVVLTPEPVTSHRPDAPPELVTIIARCLEKQPRHRYQDAATLLAELDPLVTPGGGMTPTETAPLHRAGRWARVAAAGITIGIVITIAALASRDVGEPGSGTWRQLTFRGDLTEAALSPDGQFLAYAAVGDGSELFVHDLESGSDLRVAEGGRIRRVSWSPNGSEIRFLRIRDSIVDAVAVPRLGGTMRVLPYTEVSPGERRVATIPTSGGRLRVLDLETRDSTIVQLDVGERFAGGHSWSPDGRLLAIRLLSPGIQNGSIVVVQPGPGKWREVLRDSTMLSEPVWDPDGGALYYLRRAGGVSSIWRLGIGPDGTSRGRPEMISSGVPEPDLEGLLSSRPSVAKGGRRFVYRALDNRSNLATIALTGPPSGRGLHPLTSGTATHPVARLAPDGRRVAFVRNEGNGSVVATMTLEGGAMNPVARMARALEIAWSPDGTRLLVSGVATGDSLDALHLFSLTDGGRRTFLRGAASYDVEWLSDGRILYLRLGNRRFGTLDPVTGADSGVALPDTTGWVFWPRASPDARRFVYGWNRQTGRSPLWTAPVGGGTPRSVAGAGWVPLRFSADGSTLYTARTNATFEAFEVASLNLAGGQVRTLIHLPPGTTALDITPDGRTLLLSTRESRADVWEVVLPPSH